MLCLTRHSPIETPGPAQPGPLTWDLSRRPGLAQHGAAQPRARALANKKIFSDTSKMKQKNGFVNVLHVDSTHKKSRNVNILAAIYAQNLKSWHKQITNMTLPHFRIKNM